MKYFKSLALAGATVFALTACNKENIQPATAGAVKKPHASGSEKSTAYAWATGTDNRVYKWNGTSWDEPNTAARMTQVSVSQDGNGAVWALGTVSNKVYKWNGASWDEPNTAAGLYAISAYSSTDAWGIGAGHTIYHTTNGGSNWTSISTSGLPSVPVHGTGLISISVVDGTHAEGVATDNKPYYYNPSTSSWVQMGSPGSQNLFTISSAAALSGGSYSTYSFWAIAADASGARTTTVLTGPTYSSPTPTASMLMVSASLPALGTSQVWAIGYDNRVYKWNGTSWDEPNTAARMATVSSGWH